MDAVKLEVKLAVPLQVVRLTRARGLCVCGAQDSQGELEGRGVGEGPHHSAQGQDCGVSGRNLHPGHGHEGGQGMGLAAALSKSHSLTQFGRIVRPAMPMTAALNTAQSA